MGEYGSFFEWFSGFVGIVGGAGGLTALYNAKTNKESLAIKNLREVIDEIKEHHEEYRNKSEVEIEELRKRFSALELRDRIKRVAIDKSYRCSHIPKDGVCPVSEHMEKACERLEKEFLKCNLDPDKKE